MMVQQQTSCWYFAPPSQVRQPQMPNYATVPPRWGPVSPVSAARSPGVVPSGYTSPPASGCAGGWPAQQQQQQQTAPAMFSQPAFRHPIVIDGVPQQGSILPQPQPQQPQQQSQQQSQQPPPPQQQPARSAGAVTAPMPCLLYQGVPVPPAAISGGGGGGGGPYQVSAPATAPRPLSNADRQLQMVRQLQQKQQQQQQLRQQQQQQHSNASQMARRLEEWVHHQQIMQEQAMQQQQPVQNAVSLPQQLPTQPQQQPAQPQQLPTRPQQVLTQPLQQPMRPQQLQAQIHQQLMQPLMQQSQQLQQPQIPLSWQPPPPPQQSLPRQPPARKAPVKRPKAKTGTPAKGTKRAADSGAQQAGPAAAKRSALDFDEDGPCGPVCATCLRDFPDQPALRQHERSCQRQLQQRAAVAVKRVPLPALPPPPRLDAVRPCRPPGQSPAAAQPASFGRPQELAEHRPQDSGQTGRTAQPGRLPDYLPLTLRSTSASEPPVEVFRWQPGNTTSSPVQKQTSATLLAEKRTPKTSPVRKKTTAKSPSRQKRQKPAGAVPSARQVTSDVTSVGRPQIASGVVHLTISAVTSLRPGTAVDAAAAPKGGVADGAASSVGPVLHGMGDPPDRPMGLKIENDLWSVNGDSQGSVDRSEGTAPAPAPAPASSAVVPASELTRPRRSRTEHYYGVVDQFYQEEATDTPVDRRQSESSGSNGRSAGSGRSAPPDGDGGDGGGGDGGGGKGVDGGWPSVPSSVLAVLKRPALVLLESLDDTIGDPRDPLVAAAAYIVHGDDVVGRRLRPAIPRVKQEVDAEQARPPPPPPPASSAAGQEGRAPSSATPEHSLLVSIKQEASEVDEDVLQPAKAEGDVKDEVKTEPRGQHQRLVTSGDEGSSGSASTTRRAGSRHRRRRRRLISASDGEQDDYSDKESIARRTYTHQRRVSPSSFDSDSEMDAPRSSRAHVSCADSESRATDDPLASPEFRPDKQKSHSGSEIGDASSRKAKRQPGEEVDDSAVSEDTTAAAGDHRGAEFDPLAESRSDRPHVMASASSAASSASASTRDLTGRRPGSQTLTRVDGLDVSAVVGTSRSSDAGPLHSRDVAGEPSGREPTVTDWETVMTQWTELAGRHRAALCQVQTRAHQVRYLRERLRAALRCKGLLPPAPAGAGMAARDAPGAVEVVAAGAVEVAAAGASEVAAAGAAEVVAVAGPSRKGSERKESVGDNRAVVTSGAETTGAGDPAPSSATETPVTGQADKSLPPPAPTPPPPPADTQGAAESGSQAVDEGTPSVEAAASGGSGTQQGGSSKSGAAAVEP